MRELRAAGYVVLRQERSPGGRTRRYLEVYDVPQPSAERAAFGATRADAKPAKRRTADVWSHQAKREFPQAAPNAGIPAAGGPALDISTSESTKSTARGAREPGLNGARLARSRLAGPLPVAAGLATLTNGQRQGEDAGANVVALPYVNECPDLTPGGPRYCVLCRRGIPHGDPPRLPGVPWVPAGQASA